METRHMKCAFLHGFQIFFAFIFQTSSSLGEGIILRQHSRVISKAIRIA